MNRRIVGQTDATKVPRYAGLATFARLPTEAEAPEFDVAIVGVPFDAGVTYRPGARFGPSAVRQASRLLRPYHPASGTSPFDSLQVVDLGDIAASPFSIEDALASIQQGLAAVLATGARFVAIGGDHTIALPALRAVSAKHGPVALVHFDAHLDTWDTYFGEPYTHGTPFRRASEEGLLDHEASVHVGIRGSLYSAGDLADDGGMGFLIFGTDDVAERGPSAIAAEIRARIGPRPLYVSVDIDVLDPAHAPGTGTPEIGGLTSRELVTMLRKIRGLNVVGCDVVEVSPAYDHAEITAVAAANIVYEMLTLFVPVT
ncbi:MAG TPA: agmatinase [Candidatus Limnocylindria bacterium]